MIYQISSDNIDLSPSTKTLAHDKLSKLERFFTNYPEDAVTVRAVINTGAAEDTFEVRVDITAKGSTYFSEERDYSVETTLIKVVQEIEKQLEKDRSKREKDWDKIREMKGVDPLVEDEV